jgi:hypothetical protein
MFPPLTLAVVGADYDNKGKSPPRRFELAMCIPGEPVELLPEPKNPADEHAIAVFSFRGIQIGYITAERAPMIGKRMREGYDVVAVFQAPAIFGAYIRVSFDGSPPDVPDVPQPSIQRPPPPAEDQDFRPDPIYDD